MTSHKIRQTEWGIAYTSGRGNIYINKHLKAYNPELYDKILKHELSHELGDYNSHDLEHDMEVDFFPLRDKIKFCLKHPKAWLFLSPIIVSDDEIMVSSLSLFKLGVVVAILLFIIVLVM